MAAFKTGLTVYKIYGKRRWKFEVNVDNTVRNILARTSICSMTHMNHGFHNTVLQNRNIYSRTIHKTEPKLNSHAYLYSRTI